MAAALSRMAATSVSFVLCLIYLALLPFHPWALALLVGVSALVVTLIGRPGDAVTAGITTAVVMVVAAVSPQHAWQQPILRFADTVIGVGRRRRGRLAGPERPAPVAPQGPVPAGLAVAPGQPLSRPGSPCHARAAPGQRGRHGPARAAPGAATRARGPGIWSTVQHPAEQEDQLLALAG